MAKKTTTTTSTGGTLKRTLNRDEKNELFAKHAVWMMGTNMFPVNKAVDLFGADAVAYCTKDNSRGGAWYMGQGQYIDLKGFGYVVMYHNSMLYCAEDAGAR